MPAHAGVTLTFSQSGNDVVADSVGSLNLTGAVQYATGLQSTFIESQFGVLFAGQPGAGQQQGTVNLYRLTANGGVFGTGAPAGGSSTVASIFGINADQSYLSVGQGYVNGASLSGRLTFAGQTFASLRLTAGTFTYRIPNDLVTIVVPGAVPEPATWAMMIAGFGMVGGVLCRRRNVTTAVTYA